MENLQEPIVNPKPPKFLGVLCYLSMSNGLFNVIDNLTKINDTPISKEELVKNSKLFLDNVEKQVDFDPTMWETLEKTYRFSEVFIETNQYMNQHIFQQSLTITILNIVSFYGAFEMYRLKKRGLVSYIFAQVSLVLFFPLLHLTNIFTISFAISSSIILLIFIGLYFSQRKHFIN